MSDAEESYFVRWRGRVTGPYALKQLEELVAQGLLSRLHDLSRDQVAWQQADTVEALYPKYERRTPEKAATPGQRDDESAQPSESSLQQWYYSISGSVEGPCSADVVRQLIGDGTLSGSDYVSRLENPEDWRFVMEVPEFDDVRHSRKEASAGAEPDHDESLAQTKSRGLARTSMILGIVGIGLMPLGILAIIFGGLAKSRMNCTENYAGLRMATAGIVMGIVDMALLVLLILAVIFFGWPPIPIPIPGL